MRKKTPGQKESHINPEADFDEAPIKIAGEEISPLFRPPVKLALVGEELRGLSDFREGKVAWLRMMYGPDDCYALLPFLESRLPRSKGNCLIPTHIDQFITLNPIKRDEYRSADAITSHRNFCVEFDNDSIKPFLGDVLNPEWLSFQQAAFEPLKGFISSLVYSGNKSIHGYISLDEPVTKEKWENISNRLYQYLSKTSTAPCEATCCRPYTVTRTPWAIRILSDVESTEKGEVTDSAIVSFQACLFQGGRIPLEKLEKLLEGVEQVVDRKKIKPREVSPGNSVFQQYNANVPREEVRELLEKHGWKHVRSRSDGHDDFQRPGQTISDKIGGVLNPSGSFNVWTTDAPRLIEGLYTPFDLYKSLEHDGSNRQAADALQNSPHVKVADSDNLFDHYSISSDRGFTDIIIHIFGDNVKYCRENGRFYIWNGEIWESEAQGSALERQFIIAMSVLVSELDRVVDAKRRAKLEGLVKRYNNYPARQRIKAFLKDSHEIQVKQDLFDSKNAESLNAQNGKVSLRTGALLPFDKKDYATTKIPIIYDPLAVSVDWAKFLQIFDTENYEYIHKAAGYCATGYTDERIFFYLYGPGKNGKSTFTECLHRVLSGYSAKFDSNIFTAMNKRTPSGPSNEIVAFVGKRLGVSSEIEKDAKLSEALLKQMTSGEDAISARANHCPMMEFTPRMKFFFQGNHLPKFDGSDQAMRDRYRLITCEKVVTVDKKLKSRLLGEEANREAILAWVVSGAVKYFREGLWETESMKRDTDSLFDDNNPSAEFVSEFCEFGAFKSVKRGDLYSVFMQWRRSNNERSPISRQLFYKYIMALPGVAKKKTATCDIFEGIGFSAHRPSIYDPVVSDDYSNLQLIPEKAAEPVVETSECISPVTETTEPKPIVLISTPPKDVDEKEFSAPLTPDLEEPLPPPPFFGPRQLLEPENYYSVDFCSMVKKEPEPEPKDKLLTPEEFWETMMAPPKEKKNDTPND